jgi:hypothetical protein
MPRGVAPAVWTAIALGSTALALRPAETAAAVAVTVGVGGIGVLAPLPPLSPVERRPPALSWVAAAAVGLAAFGLARLLAMPFAAPPAGALVVAATGLAAVCEEAFFRRLVYGWLEPLGAPLAVIGSAALFALVHLPAYGARVLPIDLAAGMLFGWQRWASGGWRASGLTHTGANLLQLWT